MKAQAECAGQEDFQFCGIITLPEFFGEDNIQRVEIGRLFLQ